MATAGKVIQCRAAVCWAANEPLVIEQISVDPPKEKEVRVRIVSASFCHSDLHAIMGHTVEGLMDTQFPLVVGHEGAGVVESVGPDVTTVKPGDHVIPMFGCYCGECALCKLGTSNMCITNLPTRAKGLLPDGTSRLSCKGKPVYTMIGCATLSEYFVLDERCVAKINPAADLKRVGLAGCCIPTGVGAVRNVAQVTPGSNCAVWGLGAVGLSVVMACKLAGAANIIGIDISPVKEALGKKFGCTEFINPNKLDVPVTKFLQDKFYGMGCDFTFESIGNIHTMKAAFESTRPAGGVSVILGVPNDMKQPLPVLPQHFLEGRQLRGCILGNVAFRRDVPQLVEEMVAGKIPYEQFVSDEIQLDQINWAIDEMKAGRGIRYIVQF